MRLKTIVLKKIYHLKTCSTCKRILNELALAEDVQLQDIKSKPMSAEDLESLKMLAGSYEALFSKRAQLYKAYNLKEKVLTEDDYKAYLLEHYTFLKRPVIVVNDNVFIGNSKATIAKAKQALYEL